MKSIRKSIVALSLFSLFTNVSFAQANKDFNTSLKGEWLAVIENDTVYADEFWYNFTKNSKANEVINKDSLDSYRKLFTNFLLRVRQAKDLGLDTTKKFLKEFEGYKNQLAESYLKDDKVTDQLVKEAYDRSKVDVEASHVLIGVNYHALPSDTLKAYKTALKVKKLAEQGKDFSELAKQYSTDPSVKQNGGYLGYFSVFRMVYPFESAAYNTNEGEVSDIFRTRFGYHVVKVHSKRKAVGQIKVAHIMTVVRPDMSEEKIAAAKENIDEIYEKLQNGENFRVLARKFSEDLNTASKGGELPWFGPSKFVPEFENAAFALDSNGAYSKPIKTIYGWHIIKRIDRKEVESFEKMEASIKSQVARSDRAELSEDAVINKIKKDYDFKEWRSGIDGFYKYCDTTIITGKWKAPSDHKLKSKMFRFNNKVYTQLDFARYLEKQLVPKKGGDYRRLVNHTYDTWVKQLLKDHEKSQLEQKYPEYRRLLKEYKEGIILFDLTSEKVWNRSVKDTNGLKAFHEANKSMWMWDERMEGVIYKCIDEETAKQVRKYLKKGKDDVFILEEINKDSKLNVRVEAGLYQKKDRRELRPFTFDKKVSKVQKVEDSWVVIKVNKVLPAGPKKLNDVRGIATAKYQDFLMKEWLKELNEKYTVQYNEKVYNQLLD